MLTPLETVMLATLRACTEELREHDAEYQHTTRRAVFDQILDVITKAEAKQAEDVPGVHTAMAFDAEMARHEHDHRLAHNDGFHKATPEPQCPACQRIARLESISLGSPQ